jgi:preprotein translocase subunit SecA
LKYDDVLNRQRQAIYEDRRQILEGDDISSRMREFVERTLETVVNEHLANRTPEDWDLDQLFTELKTLYPVGITVDELLDQLGLRPTVEDVLLEVQSDATIAYDRREADLGEVVMRELERRVVLSVIDRRWRDHLYEMDYLKDGIGLRAMAQRDPLIEYQREGYSLFQTMMGQIREDATGFLFNLDVQVQQAPVVGAPVALQAKGLTPAAPQENLKYSAPTADGDIEVRNESGQLIQAPPVPAAASATFQGQQGKPSQPAPRSPAGTAQPNPAGNRGTFGQQPGGGSAQAPVGNRAQRRAAKKRRGN